MFDVSHMLSVDVEGERALAFLRRALANDIARLPSGKALYSCLLADDGGILDDLIAYRLGEVRFRLVVNAATAESDFAWLENLRSPPLRPRRDLAMLAVQGPRAWERFREAGEAPAPFCAVELLAVVRKDQSAARPRRDEPHIAEPLEFSAEEAARLPYGLIVIKRLIEQQVATCIGAQETWAMRVEKRGWPQYHTTEIIQRLGEMSVLRPGELFSIHAPALELAA